MQFRVRFFNFDSVDSGFHMHGKEWMLPAPDDASGREIVAIAMRAAGWPEGPYKVDVGKHPGAIEAAITVEERPDQLITIWINKPPSQLEIKSFQYFTPIGSRMLAAAWNRLSAVGIYLVCLAGLLVIALGQLYWVFRDPERTRGIAVKVDQAANGALRGNPQETISSRANRARLKKRWWGCVLCKVLDWFKKGHCRDSAGK